MSYQVMPVIQQLPYALYTVEQVKAMEKLAIKKYNLSESELIERAGFVAFHFSLEYWRNSRRVVVFCGSGKNAGDGLVLARLFKSHNIEVSLVLMEEITKAHKAVYDFFKACCIQHIPIHLSIGEQLSKKPIDLIVDALLGTGLSRPIEGRYAKAIEYINQHDAPVLSIDVPSGLDANKGVPLGLAVKADVTMTYTGLKRGLFTADGTEYAGEVRYHALELPARVFASQIHVAKRMDWQRVAGLLPQRHRNSHKGCFGHLLIIGGAKGMLGAALLAAKAAFRCGAGKITLASSPVHASHLALSLPEAITFGVNKPESLRPLLDTVNAVVIGPGLGTDVWAQGLLEQVILSDKPTIIDADALRLLPKSEKSPTQAILTPHPGEAAFLLATTSSKIQSNRFLALEQLQYKYGNTVILKGAGTLIATQDNQPPAICTGGNPGMAVAGMGDVLAGTLGGLLAQGMALDKVAIFGTCLHSEAGDRASKENGERGMIASDLMPWLRIINNESASQEIQSR